jgi:hypothetical protein
MDTQRHKQTQTHSREKMVGVGMGAVRLLMHCCWKDAQLLSTALNAVLVHLLDSITACKNAQLQRKLIFCVLWVF